MPIATYPNCTPCCAPDFVSFLCGPTTYNIPETLRCTLSGATGSLACLNGFFLDLVYLGTTTLPVPPGGPSHRWFAQHTGHVFGDTGSGRLCEHASGSCLYSINPSHRFSIDLYVFCDGGVTKAFIFLSEGADADIQFGAGDTYTIAISGTGEFATTDLVPLLFKKVASPCTGWPGNLSDTLIATMTAPP